ncbi:MAG: ABC transporter ATP-binding protein [Bacilli bacterium]|nr:ABC transporter ATP-binding protein [Bacilli bacterium]
MNNCLEIKELKYIDLYKNFNLKIEKNKFVTISGSNNCGKTTLIRIIDGQLYTNSEIILFDKDYHDYKITEIGNIIKSVIPLEYNPIQERVEDELLYQLPTELSKEEKQKIIKDIAKTFKLTKFLTKNVESLSEEDIIKLQLAQAIISKPKILLIDDLSPIFNKQELLEITNILKDINKSHEITIIMITSILECNLQSDYTYIISNKQITLEGIPSEVLEKDNIINKAGLELPFMMDLSVKLKDYDLIKDIELDMEKMVNNLWK